MAKQMHSLQIVIEVPYAGGVAQTPKLKQVNHVTCSTAEMDLTKPGGQGPSDDPAVPRDLVSGDLTGTVQALIDGVEAASKAKEGIA